MMADQLHANEKLLHESEDDEKLRSASLRNYAACESAPLAALCDKNAAQCNDAEESVENDAKMPLRDIIKQVLIACTVHSIVIQAGINLSFSAVLLPQLEEESNNATHVETKNVIRIDKAAASWIASLVTLSLPLSALIVGSLMDKFGRKRISMLATLPFIISWLMHFWATDVRTIYLARIIGGLGSGLTTVSMIYVAEISHPRLRAALLSLNSFFVCFGILLTCVVGVLIPWRSLALCYAILSFSSCLAITLLPESPHWLHSFKNRTTHANSVLSFLYSNEDMFAIEARRLWENHLQRQAQESGVIHCWSILKQPQVYKPFAVLFFLFFLQQLTGCYVIVFYAVDVFRKIGNGAGLGEYKALVVLGAIRFIASICSAILSVRIGRKVLMLVSAGGMMVSALVAACTSGLVTSWCLLVYVAFGGIGILVIPWTLLGELLPMQVRGKLSGLLCAIAYIFMFGMVKSFPDMLSALDMRVLFYYSAGVNVVLCYFIVTCVPETFRKSFGQIEAFFR